MAITVAQAREICTKAELDLVLQSTTRQIGSLDVKQLRSAVRRARTARDKWRDRAHTQTRESKAEAPGEIDQPNARSNDKAQLFDEALGRFEKRLARVERSTNGAAGGAAKTTPPSARAAEQPGKRAEMRSPSNDKPDAAKTPAPHRKAPAKATAKATAKPSAATSNPAEGDGKSIKKPMERKAVSKKGTTKKSAPKRRAAPKASTDRAAASKPAGSSEPAPHGLAAAAIAAGRDGGGDKPTAADKKRNLKAKTAAKASATSRSGAPRIQGHVSSQGRRNQAKRSSR